MLPFVQQSVSVKSSKGNNILMKLLMEHFFVAYPPGGKKEGYEKERVKFFMPSAEDLNRKIEVTGFAEAVKNFTENFTEQANTSKYDWRLVSTEKTEQIFIYVEDDAFILGVSLMKAEAATLKIHIFAPAIVNVLKVAYEMFVVFHGSFLSYMRNHGDAKFQTKLETFFTPYLNSLKLHQASLLDYWDGPIRMKVPDKLMLQVQDLFGMVEEIRSWGVSQNDEELVMVFYQDKLLYNTLSDDDVCIMNHYITNLFLPSLLRCELDFPSSGDNINGRLIDVNGNGVSIDGDGPISVLELFPTVRLKVYSKCTESYSRIPYRMLPYRLRNMTVFLFANASCTIARKQLRLLKEDVDLVLSKIINEIDEFASADDLNATDFHFIYYNKDSLSMTSSFEAGRNAVCEYPPLDVHKAVADAIKGFDKTSAENGFAQSFIKSDTNWWIVSRKVLGRYLVLMLPSPSHLSLNDILFRVSDIIRTYFDGIFLSVV